MRSSNPTFTFKPGSIVDQVLQLQPGAHCRRAGNRYVVYISRKSRMTIGTGYSAHGAWTDALATLKNNA